VLPTLIIFWTGLSIEMANTELQDGKRTYSHPVTSDEGEESHSEGYSLPLWQVSIEFS